MARNFSLTGRIIASMIAGQLLLTAGLAALAMLYSRSELRRAFDSALQGHATATLALVRYTETNPPGLLFDSSLVPPSSDLVHRDVFEIFGPDGSLLARSGGPVTIPADVEQATDAYSEFALGGRRYRAVVLRNVTVLDNEETLKVPSHVTVIYAASMGELRERLGQLGLWIAGSSLVLLAIAIVVTVWAVRRGLAPLHDLAATAGTISVRNWDFHPPADASLARELAPLTAAIETVLSGLRESFRQQRDFTSDAAHELKTSVAIVKSTLQSLLQKPRPEAEYRAGLDGLLEDCERLEVLLERMLRLARIEQWAEQGPPRTQAPAELLSTCEAAISRMQRLANAREIVLEMSPAHPGAVQVLADPQDLEVIWDNLLENAVQYSPAGSKVTLRVERNGGGVVIVSVEDSGPGIPAEELPKIFERFHRGDPSRSRSTGGFGLGLAVCKAMVTAYGGQIEARNRAVHGAEVRVMLPVEAE